jgi:hypothetical protein
MTHLADLGPQKPVGLAIPHAKTGAVAEASPVTNGRGKPLGHLATTTAARRQVTTTSNWAYWALPLAALAGLGWYFFSGDRVTRQLADTPKAVDQMLGRIDTIAAAPAGSVHPFKVPPGSVSIGTYYNREVHNTAGERIGVVNDFLIAPDGRVTATVIGVASQLGLGEKEIAVPFSASQIAHKKDNNRGLVIDASKDALQRQPAFDYSGTRMRLDRSKP